MKVITHTKPKKKISAFFDRFTEKDAAESYQKLVSSTFELGQIPKNNDELADYKAEKLHEVLNRFIEKGITFDVSATDFQVIDPAQILKTSDREFLKLNDAAILCTLQQSLLMKHLFSISPDALEDFTFDVAERGAIMTNGADIPFAVHCEAVKDVSSNWFDRLLNSLETAETICRLLAADAAQDTANGKASLD
jgi:hypothetical protein